MKILKFAILISFLFNSVAYPYEDASNTLRLPMMSGDKVNQERFKFSLQNYRPGWTFAGWGAAKKAIKQKFTSTKERKEALQLVRTFARKYAENKISLRYDTLEHAIPAVVEAAKDIEELKLFIERGIKLAEKNINPYYILQFAIPAVAKVSKSTQKRKAIWNTLFNLNETLDKKVYYPYVLQAVIVKAAKAARNNMSKLEIFINLVIKYAENEIPIGTALENLILRVTKVPKPAQELKNICDALFDLRVLPENKGIDSASFYNLIDQSLEAAGDSSEDFKEVCNDVMPEMTKKIKNAKVFNFIKAEHIKIALELQREYGGFKISTISYRSHGTGAYKIQVLPLDFISTKLASMHAVDLNQSL